MAEMKHGTGAAYCAGACRCDECKRWARERMADYRKRNPGLRVRERAYHRAEARALRVLAGLHVEEFERLFDQERAVEGLPPVGTALIGRPPSRSAHRDGGGA